MGETFLWSFLLHTSFGWLIPALVSFVFFVCSFFFFFSCFLTDCHFFSFHFFPLVHSALLLMIFLSFSNQTILPGLVRFSIAEWLFVMQSSAGRRVVCSARGGLSSVCYAGTLHPSNEGNPLVFWWIAVTLLWPGRGDFSASDLSTFKKIALTSALDCHIKIGGCLNNCLRSFAMRRERVTAKTVFDQQNTLVRSA